MSELAVRVEKIAKCYQIGQAKSGDLRESLSGWINKLRGISNGQAGESKEFWALKDINFEVKKGEAVGIIGKNGAGKSTLLKILSRITEPSRGRFEIDGRVSSLLEVGTGFHPELSGRENIYLNGTILGMKRREIKEKFGEIVAFSGVGDFIDTPVKHYSSGMKVRLAFSVAAHLEPEILIVDEVLAVGDAEFQKKCLGKMEDVTGQGRTVLFVSHNLEALRTLCGSSLILQEGRVLERGDSSSLVSKYLSMDENQTLSGTAENMAVKDAFVIDKFSFIKNTVSQFEDIEYQLKITPYQNNKISQVTLLIFDSFDKRIAIIDLRNSELFSITSKGESINIQGEIQNINMLPGVYYVGLYISSLNFTGNLFKLIKLEVLEEETTLIPYPKEVRGIIDLKHFYRFF